MRGIVAVFLWELHQGLQNRFLQVFALACLAGGAALFGAAPGREVLPTLLIQAILFFGSLFAVLVGWSRGQEAREQGAFLFAQPLGRMELIIGQLLGTASWGAVLLLLFMGPAAVRAGMSGTVLALIGLAVGFLLVCATGGLVIGLGTGPVSGLLAVLLAWAVSVAGWELGLLLLTQAPWLQEMPSVFVGLLLVNPTGMFRIAAMVGLEAVPFDAAELETAQIVFRHIELSAIVIFAGWLVVLLILGVWRLNRQEF